MLNHFFKKRPVNQVLMNLGFNEFQDSHFSLKSNDTDELMKSIYVIFYFIFSTYD